MLNSTPSGQRFIGATLGGDAHTEGLFKAARLARRGGIEADVLPPAAPSGALEQRLLSEDPRFLGLSYRLTPETGVVLLRETLERLRRVGLLLRAGGEARRIAFAGLPETIHRLQEQRHLLPCEVFLVAQPHGLRERAEQVLEFLDIRGSRRSALMAALENEFFPPAIPELDQLAEAVVASDYMAEPPLPVPSPAARSSLPVRIRESGIPLIRTHFGIPGESIQPTVEGIAALAEARVIDEVSLGSSDLSQRHFGHPEAFRTGRNDGGVPYATEEDLRALVMASRRGNFPSVKPYAHVVGLVPFIDTCLRCGALEGAHQAIPLFWFNELDGRGPAPVPDSIREHLDAVAHLARRGIPVEMNDPNQWSSRWAHDTVVAADYALIAAVMTEAGVSDMVLQMQVTKPNETGDYADLAKMLVGLELAHEIAGGRPGGVPAVWRETRTGIESLSPDLQQARKQLARSTLLQMLLDPHIIHLVSFCEANHAATVADVVESSRIVRRAVRLFREHAPLLRRRLQDEILVARRRHLRPEAETLLHAIARLHPSYTRRAACRLGPLLANADVLAASIACGYMAAPGIVHPGYRREDLLTAPGPHGGFDCVAEDGAVIGEEERLDSLAARGHSHHDS